MKIVVKDQKEYDDLMAACQVIHDFKVWLPTNWEDDKLSDLPEGSIVGITYQQGNDSTEAVEDTIKLGAGIDCTVGIGMPLEDYPILNWLAHGIYDTDNDDWRQEHVQIEQYNDDNQINTPPLPIPPRPPYKSVVTTIKESFWEDFKMIKDKIMRHK